MIVAATTLGFKEGEELEEEVPPEEPEVELEEKKRLDLYAVPEPAITQFDKRIDRVKQKLSTTPYIVPPEQNFAAHVPRN